MENIKDELIKKLTDEILFLKHTSIEITENYQYILSGDLSENRRL